MNGVAKKLGSHASILLEVIPAEVSEWKLLEGETNGKWDNVFVGLENPPARFAGHGDCSYLGKTRQTGTLVIQPATAPGIYPASGAVKPFRSGYANAPCPPDSRT